MRMESELTLRARTQQSGRPFQSLLESSSCPIGNLFNLYQQKQAQRRIYSLFPALFTDHRSLTTDSRQLAFATVVASARNPREEFHTPPVSRTPSSPLTRKSTSPNSINPPLPLPYLSYRCVSAPCSSRSARRLSSRGVDLVTLGCSPANFSAILSENLPALTLVSVDQ